MIDIHAKAHVKNALRKLRKHPTDAMPDEHHHCLKQRIAFYQDNFRLGVKGLTDRNNKDRLACGRFYHGLRGLFASRGRIVPIRRYGSNGRGGVQPSGQKMLLSMIVR